MQRQAVLRRGRTDGECCLRRFFADLEVQYHLEAGALPSWLCSVMTPPIMSTMFLVMAMPRPVPCTLLVTEFSARLKDS